MFIFDKKLKALYLKYTYLLILIVKYVNTTMYVQN